MTELLSGNDLCLFRGDRCLFKNLEFALNQGELLVIEGPNGSGKTSLLRAVAGLLEFESGVVNWDGVTIRDNHQSFRADLVWLSHRVGFKGDLNILENLKFESGLRASDQRRLGEVLERLSLSRLVELPFRSLSAGQQRRVALARMLLASARLWIMDEPFTNLDKAGQALVTELIGEHIRAGGSCMVASHQPLEIDGHTRRVTLQ
ncbi:MAG: cytochrome c biogenesis heme-transporting ATPase CcmA [Gammaproteobacteria bacterium]|nr:cytochrome c biogenesis heme-transporting ATPase CcmA [Gammaproteobacteria bacterium]